MTIRMLVSAVAFAAVLASAPCADAASGDLDGSFGGCGVVITNIGAGGQVKGLALQPDGKIVAVGSRLVSGSAHGVPFTSDIVVLRYNDDGTLDGSFGSGGIVVTGRSTDSFEDGRSVVVQPDGKIVVGGATTLVRYDGNGTLDGTFGTGGIVADVWANALVLQPDGKLVTAGQTSGNDIDFQVARYEDDGDLDATFGTAGVVITPLSSNFDQAYGLVLQPDGKLVAAGSTSSGTRNFALARYDADGALDGTFGTAGIVVDDVTPANDSLAALVLQPDGKLLGGGTIYDFVVARFDTDGTRDSGFGTGGLATASFGTFSEANAVALQSAKIIAAGSNGNQVTIVAFNADGTLDGAFGSGGIVTTQVSTGAATNALVVQADGKLVVGGATFPGKAFVARYFGTEGTIGGPAGPCPTATPSVTPTPTLTATPTPTVTPTVVPACAAVPAIDCRKPTRPQKSKMQLKDRSPDRNDSLLWAWSSGAATTKAEFGDPVTTTSYALCIYDRTGGAPALVLSARIPSNVDSGSCGGKPCWKETTRGYKRSDKLGTPGGVRTVLLREGADGSAKITVKGKGIDLDMPTLPLAQDTGVTVQLVKDGGLCWDADYSVPATKNATSEFKDSSD